MGCGTSSERQEKDNMKDGTSGKKKGKEKKKKGRNEEEFSPIVHETNDILSPIQETDVSNGRRESVTGTAADTVPPGNNNYNTAATPSYTPGKTSLKTPAESRRRTLSTSPDELLAFVSSSTLDDTPQNAVFRAVEASETYIPNLPPVPVLQAAQFHRSQRVPTPPPVSIYGEEVRGIIKAYEELPPSLKAVEVRATRRHPFSSPRPLRAVEIYEPAKQITPVAASKRVSKDDGILSLKEDPNPTPHSLSAIELCGKKKSKPMKPVGYLQAVEVYDSKNNPDKPSNSLMSSSSQPFAVAAAKIFHSDMGTVTTIEDSSLSGLISSFGEAPLDHVIYSGTTPSEGRINSISSKQELLPVYRSPEYCPPQPKVPKRKDTSEEKKKNTPANDVKKEETDTAVGAGETLSPKIIYLPYEIPEKSPVRRTPSPYPSMYKTPSDQKRNKTPNSRTLQEKEEKQQKQKTPPPSPPTRERPPISPKRPIIVPKPNRASEVTPPTEPLTEPREFPVQMPVQITPTAPLDSGVSITYSDEMDSSAEFLRKAVLTNSSGWETLRQLRLVLQMREAETAGKEGQSYYELR
ncbi:hypothetical protein LSM04_001860 [Trypanosoma melophagium]|uniref:uncharacterized protein n=1 Tax=Trypanosoma melophagium TaxID=715481 RepID=UPI00351A6C6A|nr:hypothetical protein LSM04_001860 [Trypanosoma melophagium]